MATTFNPRGGQVYVPPSISSEEVLAQVYNPDEAGYIPERLETQTVLIPNQRMGGGFTESQKINPEYDQYATRVPYTMGGFGGNINEYKIPTGQTFQGQPLIATYDAQGNFKFAGLPEGQVFTPDPSQPNIVSQPRFNSTGGITNYGVFDVNQQDDGGFGSFLSQVVSDFGPMIALGLGANYLAGNLGGLLGTGAAGAGAASSGTGLTLGGSGLGLSAGGSGLGITAGSAGASSIGAGIGSTLAGITTGIGTGALEGLGSGAGGFGPVDYSLGSGSAIPSTGTGIDQLMGSPGGPGGITQLPSTGTGLTANTGTGLNLVADTGGGLGLNATTGTGLDLAATTGGGLGLTAGSAGSNLIGAGLGDTLAAINTGINTGLSTGVNYGLTTGGGTGGGTGITAGGGTGGGTGITAGGMSPVVSSVPDLGSLGSVGTAILDFAKANPSISGALLGAVTSAIGAKDAPTSQTATTSIDPQIKAEYLANLERAKQTAAGLEARQIAQPGQLYNDAERNLYNLGMTPFGAEDIARFFNPFQEQVVQGALGDIERTRLMQEQSNRDAATRARAFGGSRQAVVTGITNEAALRQAATTGAQLRSTGFNTAANLGLQARPLTMAGLQTSLGLGTTRTALEQARLDALRNLGTERLGITSGALGLQPANVGQTSTQPLYNNTAGSLLSGGLTGAYIGSLLGKA